MLADDPEGKMLIFGISLPAIEKKKKGGIICFLPGKMNIDYGLCSEGFRALTTTADINLQDVL